MAAEAETTRAMTSQTRFDQADRDRIRRTLLRYMEENRIGVPTLQKLVAEANDVRLDHVPLKTLQRFLGDTHRSNDIMVRFCHRFTSDLPDEDPLAELGEALVSFLGVASGKAGWQALPMDLNGVFAGRIEPATTGLQATPAGFDHWVPYSTLTVEHLPARPFAAAHEIVTNWRRTKTTTADQPTRRIYEGVVLHPAGSLFALMRNVLTSTPRLYWLTPGEPFAYRGYGHESICTLDETPLTGSPLFGSIMAGFDMASSEPLP